MSYHVFTRAWWRHNPEWPGGREPCPGKRRTLCHAYSEEEAREVCRAWNQKNPPGFLSVKAEYEEL